MSCVVYVEGKQPLLRSLKQVLEPENDVVAMADNALSLVDAISSLAPALVVMDLTGQSSEGSIVRHIRHRFPEPAMVVLMDEADSITIREALSWGVQGVVARSRATEDLCLTAASALKRKAKADAGRSMLAQPPRPSESLPTRIARNAPRKPGKKRRGQQN